MVNWVKLANNIIASEFPSFGVLNHLATSTRLDKSKFKRKEKRLAPSALASLKALSDAWGLDFAPWLCPHSCPNKTDSFISCTFILKPITCHNNILIVVMILIVMFVSRYPQNILRNSLR